MHIRSPRDLRVCGVDSGGVDRGRIRDQRGIDSAIIGEQPPLKFYIWAFEPEGWRKKPLSRTLRDENYEQLDSIDSDVAVYGDGIRFSWSVHGLWIFVSPVGIMDGTPAGTYQEIRRAVLDDLIRMSEMTPYEP